MVKIGQQLEGDRSSREDLFLLMTDMFKHIVKMPLKNTMEEMKTQVREELGTSCQEAAPTPMWRD